MSKLFVRRHLWRWYSLLVIANVLDLVFTYFGLSRGFFQEANPIAAARLGTFWPIGMKTVGLTLLAFGILGALRTTRRPQQRQRFAMGAVVLTAGIYGFVVILHIVYLLTRGV